VRESQVECLFLTAEENILPAGGDAVDGWWEWVGALGSGGELNARVLWVIED